MEADIRTGVTEIVQRQISSGLDVINDGEQGRSQYAASVKERLAGCEGERLVRAHPRLGESDLPDDAGRINGPRTCPSPPALVRLPGRMLPPCNRILPRCKRPCEDSRSQKYA